MRTWARVLLYGLSSFLSHLLDPKTSKPAWPVFQRAIMSESSRVLPIQSVSTSAVNDSPPCRSADGIEDIILTINHCSMLCENSGGRGFPSGHWDFATKKIVKRDDEG
ncbi:hypothetical protein F4809DRAFT_114955 [Biscogniauxia mediterranea]|nr:hypothetical protein F4809DRAFT_114955 [Biscogniauxia mediterranea]